MYDKMTIYFEILNEMLPDNCLFGNNECNKEFSGASAMISELMAK